MRNDPLLVKYPVRIREVTLGVILFISFLFYAFPKFLGEGQKTTTTFREEIESFDIPQTEQMKIPEPPARPSVPVASEDEFFDEDITIEDTEIEDFEDWEGPGLGAGPEDEFIPYDQAPVPKIPLSSLIVYPELAREAGIEGKVYVKAFINNRGIVTAVKILKGIPNTGLDEAAVTAIKKTRFRPAKQRERAVGVWISIPVNFRLK